MTLGENGQWMRPGPERSALMRLASAWTPVLAWAGAIFAFSAQSDLRFVPDDGLDFVVRKLAHMAVFGVLALLVWRAIAMTTERARPWASELALTVIYPPATSCTK